MTQYLNSFESGINGNDVTTTSSSGSDTNFTGRGTNTGATIKYSNAITINGLLSAQFSYATATAAYLEYAVSPPTATSRVSARGYYYLGDYPSSGLDAFIFFKNSGGSAAAVLLNSPTGFITMAGANSGYTPPRKTWLRIEAACTPGTTSGNGKSEIAIYLGESVTPVASATNSVANTGTSIITSVRFGSDAGLDAHVNYVDSVAADDAPGAGFIGPAFTDMGGSPSAWLGV